MKSAKFIKFPCRFQAEDDTAEDFESLGLPTPGSGEYSVSDIWLDVHRVQAFSRHTSKHLTWATLDNGISLALEVNISKFVAELSKYLDIEPMTQESAVIEGPQYLLDHNEEDESLLNEEESGMINEILDDLDILPDDDSEEEGPGEEDPKEE